MIVGLRRAAMAAAIATVWLVSAAAVARGESIPFSVASDFTLTDHHGQRRSGGEFRGQPVLLYFGYTSCPHSCAMVLNTVSSALDLLGDDVEAIAALFVSIDDEFDSPETLATYLTNFHPAIVGLTGSQAEVAQLRTGLGAAARRMAEPGGFVRLFEHSTFLYLLGPAGELLSILPPIVPPDRLAAIVARHL